MKILALLTVCGVALLGLSSCDTLIEWNRKAALERKTDVPENKIDPVCKIGGTDAAYLTKQAALDADASRARAEAAKKAAETHE